MIPFTLHVGLLLLLLLTSMVQMEWLYEEITGQWSDVVWKRAAASWHLGANQEQGSIWSSNLKLIPLKKSRTCLSELIEAALSHP